MKQILVVLAIISWGYCSNAQDLKNFKLYHPEEKATIALQKAVAKAAKEKKHVFVQIGGNWCIWCARFHEFTTKDTQIDSLLQSSFVIYHLNYSKENKNLPILAKYMYPQRFGFPVFLILDGKGKLLHIQNSAYLEEGKGYSKEKVMDFLSAWTHESLDPGKYR